MTQQPDAATWHATPQDEAWWAPSTPEMMTAILLTREGAGIIEIPRHQPQHAIRARVGDPLTERVRYTLDALIWVGDNSQRTNEFNPGATSLITELLNHITTGNYAASDRARAHTRALLDTPGFVPAIYGNAVITGVADDGEPGPLSEAFTHWFDSTATVVQSSLDVDVLALAALLDALGIDPGTVLETPDTPDSP
ncbi:hypothetical protein [Saccharopolyspora sp. NPDC049426]|uniref:hypothetical protein n=1 Tax=Saccharopolyspora sp. NPDC049426 TaxID=3155652 RepID=UPI003445B6CC